MFSALSIAVFGLGTWAESHDWCHRRQEALSEGDRAALEAGDLAGMADALGAGVRRATVSPDVAELACGAGALPLESAIQTRSGAYRRRHDRSLIADLAWLPLFLGAAMAPPAGPGLIFCLAVAFAAMADARFRVIPLPALLFMALSAPFALLSIPLEELPWGSTLAVYAVALIAAAALWVAKAVADRMGVAFGAADVPLLALMLASLGLRPALVFCAALCLACVVVLAYSRISGKGASTVPLATLAALPYLIAVATA